MFCLKFAIKVLDKIFLTLCILTQVGYVNGWWFSADFVLPDRSGSGALPVFICIWEGDLLSVHPNAVHRLCVTICVEH